MFDFVDTSTATFTVVGMVSDSGPVSDVLATRPVSVYIALRLVTIQVDSCTRRVGDTGSPAGVAIRCVVNANAFVNVCVRFHSPASICIFTAMS